MYTDETIETTETVQEPILTNDNSTVEEVTKAETDAKEKALKDNLTAPKDDISNIFAKAFVESYAKPAIAEGLVNKEKFVEIYGDGFLKNNKGNKSKANDEMSKIYELISTKYQAQAAEELNYTMLDNVAHLASGVEDVDFIGEDYTLDIFVSPETISGRKQMFNDWTDPTQTIEQAALKSKKVLDYKGDIIEYENDAYTELALNKDFANAEGKTIVGFENQGYSEFDRDKDEDFLPVTEFIEKPIDMDVLIDKIRAALGQ